MDVFTRFTVFTLQQIIEVHMYKWVSIIASIRPLQRETTEAMKSY